MEADDSLDERLAALPNRPAVFLIQPREGRPYLGRTTQVRRRLLRLLGPRPPASRLLSLRQVVSRVEYRLTASWLETNLVFYQAARSCYPDTYRSIMKLRLPPYLKVGLSNPFPRCFLTSRLGGARGLWYGPFRTRAAAEQFQSQFLDLFRMRRCQENLAPSPDHPGCIYGEMNMCLRPCQQRVGPQEYADEVQQVTEFLSTDGASLLEATQRARDRLSEEMEFEDAARLHKQVEKIRQVLRLRDELACDIDRLHGVAVTGSIEEGCVELWFVLEGCWLAPLRFRVAAAGGRAVSLDQRLRELAAALAVPRLTSRERQDHLALLARWYYSTFRDGEWLRFGEPAEIPYRKLVRAVSRVAAGAAPPPNPLD
jgi:excinuclease UvrABC nuclease subunit